MKKISAIIRFDISMKEFEKIMKLIKNYSYKIMTKCEYDDES